jgi:hypothetical protein
MDKKDQLHTALGRLSVRQTVTLAQTVEIQRSLGQEILPTNVVLDGVRPLLRDGQALRGPTVCRLICTGFEEFLTDRSDEPRVAGLIPRKSIGPWWAAVWHVAKNEIAALTVRLRSLLAKDATASLDAFAQEVQQAAAGWTAAIVAGLDKPKPDPELKKHLRGAVADDVRTIARILPIAQPIATSINALTILLERLHSMDGERIVDLRPEGVTLLKQYYIALSESHGTDARYLALAVANRLVQPCQILRLARALSWKPTDTLVTHTEFGCVGGRLVGDLHHLSQAIVSLVSPRHALPPPEELSRQISRYMEEAESLLNEIGFRRDSPWGEAILRTRSDLATALDRALMERFARCILAVMPHASRDSDTPTAPDASADVETALQSARFMQLLAQRGQRHGFGLAARDALAALGTELELEADRVLKQLRQDPRGSGTLRGQLEATARLFDVVFEEGRGPLLLRQIGNALRASA